MDLTPEQMAAFAETARTCRGERSATDVAKAMTARLGYKVTHQSIYQWEKPGPSKPDSIEKVRALDDELGADGRLLAIVAPMDAATAARFDAIDDFPARARAIDEQTRRSRAMVAAQRTGMFGSPGIEEETPNEPDEP